MKTILISISIFFSCVCFSQNKIAPKKPVPSSKEMKKVHDKIMSDRQAKCQKLTIKK